MLFNSLEFLIFFPTVIVLYFWLPYRFRWTLLLAASYYFYMCWKAEYVLLIIASTAIDYWAGLQMGKCAEKKQRKKYLMLSLMSNLGILFFFKYFNFFSDSTRAVLNNFNIFTDLAYFDVLLPVGISFYTFQTLSYSIDVYNGRIKPEKHAGIFAVYVSFFPQLVAGPIERSERLMPQFHKQYDFDYQRVTDGLKLMLWGFFKKLVIADKLAVVVNTVYNDPGDFTGLPVIIATYFFAFQIYCDFSGYSDIAIGAAQVMGYRLMDNFNRPYFSASISEFWKRWHISLSSWFRDYLYIPLGGNRVVKWRWYYNLFIVFLVSGLWHGANWTFVVWGALHGIYLIAAIVTQKQRHSIRHALKLHKVPKLQKFIQVFITFHLVVIAWVFFRANNVGDAIVILQSMFTDFSFSLDIAALGIGHKQFAVGVLAILFMECMHLMQRKHQMRHFLSQKPLPIRWAVYAMLLWSILIFGEFGKQEFIYFVF